MERTQRTQRIAENIRAIAARKRIKIRDLAEATGTPYSTMYAYYHGHFSIPQHKLTQIATALGVTAEALTEEVNHA
jgi:transcriptional regulator with XRE-family HTH domain